MKLTHKKHVFHMRRVGLFSVLVAAFFIVRVDAGSVPEPLPTSQVLSYATEMTHGGLLSGTNNARAANGFLSLNLDSQLNASAQAKAQDMANKNYWAHVGPDGTQPWYFFDQAGYSYTKAGENLAYGFMTSQSTVDGWMNSPSHKANILGDYRDVGFGIVNAPDYQSNGQQTIVVAHYGTRASPAPATAQPSPSTPAPSSRDTSAPAQTQLPAPTADTPTTEPATGERAAEEQPNNTASKSPVSNADSTQTAPPVRTADTSQVSVLSMVATRNAPIAALASLVMICFAVIGYALTHRSAFQHAVANGEHFVLAHPGVDAGIVAAATTLILLTTYGNLG